MVISNEQKTNVSNPDQNPTREKVAVKEPGKTDPVVLEGQKSQWKVILALDWVDRLDNAQKRAFDFIHGLSKQIHLSVSPISLIPYQTQAEKHASAHSGENLVKEFRDQVRRSLNLAPPHVVSELQTPRIKSHRMTHAIEFLHNEAVVKEADIIVTATHGRQGWQRLIHSSFVERLLLYSRIPILSVGPHFKHPRSVKHILFATNLTDESRIVLRKMTPLITALSARVTIFHSLPTPPYQKTSDHIVPLHETKPHLPRARQSDLEKHEEQVQTFLDAVTSAGGKADTFLDCSGMELIQAIEDYLNSNHVDMIALAPQSGPISSYLNGMITRKLVRQSSCPVWLLHQNPSALLIDDQTENLSSTQTSTKVNPAA